MLKATDPVFDKEVSRHLPALERETARHNLILGLLERVRTQKLADARLWSFATPGSCALQMGARNIVLGEIADGDIGTMDKELRDLPFPGIVGPGEGASRLIGALRDRGIAFHAPVSQAIHSLDRPPAYPGADGSARAVTAEDTVTFGEFLIAFCREAVPDDPALTPEQIAASAASGRYLFWISGGRPVSMAGQVRETASMGAIAAVYTPPAERGKGYAGSVTAAVCDKIFASGRALVCLYTDLSNPYSNRCYAKIGFTPVCKSFHYVRKAT